MADLDALISEALARPLTGWDLGYDGRITSVRPPWSFAAIASEAARQSPDLLDMGTGGGEWLSKLPYRPARTVATEGWAPNLPVARARLASLGIPVVAIEGAPDNVEQPSNEPGGDLPFPDGDYHLISNRHESYVPREVWRILAPGGRFLTQQVATPAADDLYRLLGLTPPAVSQPDWTLALATKQLTDVGVVVEDGQEDVEVTTFADVGALIWYVRSVPWMVPEFTLEVARTTLARLHAAVQDEALLQARLPLFWLSARKPDRAGSHQRPGASERR